ncbi:MAG: squalene/phytoene synthase family protein [Hyphomicrobium sp.]
MTRDSSERRGGEAVVREAARRSEPDRYLAALLAPRAARADLIALAAFLGEVARIPLTGSEPMIGEIRLQWWRDALVNLLGGTATGSPIADTVGAAIRSRALPEALFMSIIDARSRDLDPQAPLSSTVVDTYFNDTEGAAFQLAGHVLGVNEQPGVPELMSAAGQAYGRVCLLRSLPRLLANGRVPAPLAGVLRASDDDWVAATAPMRDSVKRWLKEVRRRARAAPRAALPAILPLALVEPYLAALERLGPNLVRQTADISPLTRVWQLWRASVLGRI